MSTPSPHPWRIAVGLGSCGIAAGATALYERLAARADGAAVRVERTGCAGACHLEPMLELYSPEGQRFTYVELTEDAVDRILAEHVGAGRPVADFLLGGPAHREAADRYLGKQKKIVLEQCGRIDPESLEASLAVGGYTALRKVLGTMSPAAVIDEVTRSGLRGRGGAGFSTGTKWKFAAAAPGPEKYIICNADEGDPGAFMDRSVLESDPHRVLEGMLIGAYAIGASRGYIYIRAEYPLAVKRLHKALADMRAAGLLGSAILGSGFAFEIEIREGAGAFVCGEETALIASIEGQRGMPRMRPPFPANKGLWGKPTNINNVETWANIPWIILQGADAFAALGTEKSKGTKVFALAGKIRRGGLVEVPMGITLREVVEEIGGGSPSGRPVKAVQTGGPSGGCIPAALFDTRIDYDELTRTGAIMGSGGMVVMDDGSCMVDIARYFLTFTARESCGKCTFCRIGTTRMLEILTRITEGKGVEADLPLLAELAEKVRATSLCALGQTAPNPVLTTLRYFRSEYEAHILDRRCPAKVCKPLLTYTIDPEACTGCTVCAKRCPTHAIAGERKQPHVVNQEQCIRCGACVEVCKFDAVLVE
ncbi:MAG: NADH-quinone oxidoreductase subunit NuoF [Candidatus Methylomirabilota bacterium]